MLTEVLRFFLFFFAIDRAGSCVWESYCSCSLKKIQHTWYCITLKVRRHRSGDEFPSRVPLNLGGHIQREGFPWTRRSAFAPSFPILKKVSFEIRPRGCNYHACSTVCIAAAFSPSGKGRLVCVFSTFKPFHLSVPMG